MKLMDIHPKTADLNKAQQSASKKSRHDALLWLAKTFPKAFDTAIKVQPLKIGIIDDIFAYLDTAEAPLFSKSKIREALAIFTRRIDYLTSLKTKNMRIDLEGNPIAMVTSTEIENATAKIKKHIEKSIHQHRNSDNTSTSRHHSLGAKTPALIKVKKRVVKPYDPNAVARLKAKLGIKKEVVECD